MSSRYAVIDDAGNVANVVIADAGFAVPNFSLVQSDVAGPGWTWTQSGGFVAPSPPPPNLPPPVSTCQMWQLQAVMTPAQWSAAQNAIAALNNPAVSAFFAHPGAQIPASSTTLLSLGASIGLSADQVKSLVQQAAAVTIP